MVDLRKDSKARSIAVSLSGLIAAVVVLVQAACMSTPGSPPSPPPLEQPAPPGADAAVSVRVDSSRSLILVEAGPFRIPPAGSSDEHHGGHGHHGANTPLLLFDWPLEGWYRGYRVRLVDANGEPLPQDVMHHLIGVNFERRQAVYPVPERFLGIGTETRDILLPKQLGVPMADGTRLGVYAAWQNDTGREIDDAYIRVALSYTPRDSGARPEEVVPIYMDTNNHVGGTNAFDLPPGRSERSYEFTLPVDGALLGLSGHLHDYGLEVRLEDAESGEVLVELDGVRDDEGRIQAVEQKIFRRLLGLLDARISLRAGHRYRVVGVYDNPTGDTIRLGGMAHLSGVFAPDSMESWAKLDVESELYRRDVAALPAPLPPERAPAGMGALPGQGRSGG